MQIRGLRNRIVHDYTGIDSYITFESIKKDIPQLKNNISDIVRKELAEGSFDKNEFAVAKTSQYLKHVDFTLLG